MSAFERKADMEHLAPRLGVSKVCLRAESRPRGAVCLMSAFSQKRKFAMPVLSAIQIVLMRIMPQPAPVQRSARPEARLVYDSVVR